MILIYGEILIDMNIANGTNNISYFVGGAPFNVAYSIDKFKQKPIFVGSVGNDYFGHKIIDFVDNCGIDSSNISILDNRNTTLAIVSNDSNGERHFSFYRNNTADYYFKDFSLDLINCCDIVHIGSLMISKPEGLKFAKSIIEKAKVNNKIISFDVNYRDDIFKSSKEALAKYKFICKNCDILKLSQDELYMFTHIKNLDKALEKFALPNQKIFITLGKDGSLLYFNHKKYVAKSIKVDCVDTTGAGDAFYGAILALIDKYGYDNFFNDEKLIVNSLAIANIQGAFVTTKKGALSSIKSIDEILDYLK